MSRSVSVPRHAQVVTYATFESEDDDFASDDFQFTLNDFREALKSRFPSVHSADEWLDNEDHVIAENRHAYFGVSEYMGLVSLWIVAKPGNYSNAYDGIKRNWIEKAEPKFIDACNLVWGRLLRKVGTFSNGEGVYEQI